MAEGCGDRRDNDEQAGDTRAHYDDVVQTLQEFGTGPRRVVVVAVDPQDVAALRSARLSGTPSANPR